MNSRLLNTFVVLMLIGSIACSQMTINKLNSIKVNKNSIANEIIQLVQLKLKAKSQGSVDEAVRLLNNLGEDLVNQQNAAFTLNTQQNVNHDAETERLNEVIAGAEALIAQYTLEIADLTQQIKETQRRIDVDTKQVALVNGKLSGLDAARVADEAAFKERGARQQQMLEAVKFIIAELQTLVASGSFVQLSNIKAKLQELVKKNPIQALVQLTMTFDADSVNYAVSKLQAIADALVASLQDEDSVEQSAAASYASLRAELVAFLNESNDDLDAQSAKLGSLKQSLSVAQDNLKNQSQLLADSQAAHAANLAQQLAENNQYAADSAQREHEGSVIDQVIQILESHAGASNRAESHVLTPQ